MPTLSPPPCTPEHHALSNLPPRQQLALRLKLAYPARTYEEIGELMGGISRQAVGKLLQRAKRKRER